MVLTLAPKLVILTVSQEICSFCAWVEVEYVLVGIFSEERGAVLGWAVSLVNKTCQYNQ